MENNTLGRILRENREKQKLSKQKVCRGLCTVMALSRYESDERIPDKFLMDALLERLGFQPSKYEFVASDQEFEYSMKRAQIEKLLYEKEMFRLAGKPCRSMKNRFRKRNVCTDNIFFLKRDVFSDEKKNIVMQSMFLSRL